MDTTICGEDSDIHTLAPDGDVDAPSVQISSLSYVGISPAGVPLKNIDIGFSRGVGEQEKGEPAMRAPWLR